MTITFITGANKGLGHETARRLLELGHTVLVGARDVGRGRAAADALGARFVQIDVTDDASVAAAVADVEAHEGGIDVLVNNAGITGRIAGPADLAGPDATQVFDTNVVGVVRTTHAFLPLLRRSAAPVIVNVTSGLGSFDRVHDAERVESTLVAPLYCASKSAVTMLTVQYAQAFPDIRVNAVDPGYTATDLNGHAGTQSVTEGTDAIVALATIGHLGADGPTGTAQDREGILPW
jgi:NAD(P)-dependent dehydrogenase (short-subunit alcohol dehydrogenase family)